MDVTEEVVEVQDYEINEESQIEVREPDDLVREFERLSSFLGKDDINTIPWQTRMGCLHRIQTICTAGVATKFPTFVDALADFKQSLANQLFDRRSKVVKETSVTIIVLVKSLRHVELSKENHSKFAHVIKYFLEEFYQTLPQTVKVISESGRTGMMEVLHNTNDNEEHILLQTLIQGSKHNHRAVRETCLGCLTIVLHKFQKQPQDEKEADDGGSGVLSLIASALADGIGDSSGLARKAARQSLIELHAISIEHFEKCRSQIPAAAQKMLQREMEAIGHKAAGKTKNNKKKGGRMSVRERMRQARLAKKKKKKTKDPSSSTADVVVVNESTATETKTVSDVDVTTGPKDPPAVIVVSPTYADSKEDKHEEKKESFKEGRRSRPSSRRNSTTSPPKKNSSNSLRRKLQAEKDIASPWRQKHRSMDLTDSLIFKATQEKKLQQSSAAMVGAVSGSGSTSPTSGQNAAMIATASMLKSSSNPSIPETVREATTSEAQSRDEELLNQLLDLKDPQLTDRMMGFLEQDGIIDLLMKAISLMSSEQIRKITRSETQVSYFDRSKVSSSYSDSDINSRQRAQTVAVNSSIKASPSKKVIASSQQTHKDVDGVGGPTSPTANASSLRVRQTASENSVAMKRSYNAMHLLCEHNPALHKVLAKKMRVVISHLLSAFHPISQANFYHVCKVFEQLNRWMPHEVLDAVLSVEGSVFFRRLFDNLHEPPVGDALLHFLCAHVESKTREKQLQLFRLILQNWKVMDVITRRICDPTESEETSSYNALFLQQFLDRMAVNKHSSILISSICEPGSLVDSLIACMCDEQPEPSSGWQRLQCANLLATLIRRSSVANTNANAATSSAKSPSKPETTSSSSIQPQNLKRFTRKKRKAATLFSSIFPVLVKKVTPYIPSLCDALTATHGQGPKKSGSSSILLASTSQLVVNSPESSGMSLDDSMSSSASSVNISSLALNDSASASANENTEETKIKFSAYTVERGFTQFRLALLDIICSVESDQVHNHIPKTTWNTLIAWFFEYRHNNMYMSRFRTLFLAALRDVNDLTITYILLKCKFLSHMIQFYLSDRHRPCTLHSFIIELCNHIRLTSDSNPKTFVAKFLERDSEWKAFVPVLRTQTEKQLEKLWTPPNPKTMSRVPDGTFVGTPMPSVDENEPSTTNEGERKQELNDDDGEDDDILQTPPRHFDRAVSTPALLTGNLIDLGSPYAKSLGYQ